MEKKRLIEMQEEYSIRGILGTSGKRFLGIIVFCVLFFYDGQFGNCEICWSCSYSLPDS